MKFPTRACVPALALLLFGAPAIRAQDLKQDPKQDNSPVILTNPDAKAAAAY